MNELKNISNLTLIELYSSVVKEMKARGVIRSNNVLGDLGEQFAIEFYNKTSGLPKLSIAPKSTQNVDALSSKGDRYSIKSTTGKVTGVFYGLPSPEEEKIINPKFEYVIIVIFDENFSVKRINELQWDDFQKYKKWHSRVRAWNLPINKDILLNTKTIFLKDI